MPRRLQPPTREALDRVEALRARLGLFSFRDGARRDEGRSRDGGVPDLELGAGSIVEWLTTAPGAGAGTSAFRMVSRRVGGRGAFVIVDPSGEAYAPALTGWGLDPARLLILRPSSLREACWGIEQCLRCPGVSATWAWIGRGLPTTVLRRWKMAAASGGGVGLLFRPDTARRDPAWSDIRLRVTPLPGGQGESRRIKIDVLYRRGGLGGGAQVWEIDHATGDVRLVPEVAHPAAADGAARA